MVSYTSNSQNARAVVLTVLIAILMCLPITSVGQILNKFEGDQPSVTVDFLTAGTVDRAAVIPWDYTATTLHATVNVTPAPHTDGGADYPLAPSINVGGAGGPEWAFTGKGYGAYGLQSGFMDDSTTYSKELIDSGKVVPPGILLPSDAQITDASIRLKGDIAKVNYSDNFNGRNGVYRVAYSENLNTVFLGGNYWGVIAKNMGDGTYRRFNTDTYPRIPEWTVNALVYSDEDDLLFIATNGGLQVIDFDQMEPIEVISRTSDLNTLTNTIYSVAYDSRTGLLVLGEAGDIAIFNYSSRTKLGYIDIGMGITVYDVEIDLANNRIWAGTSWGVFGVNMTDLQVKHRYTQTSTPSIPGYYVMDVAYDAANDKLFVGSRTTWNPYPGGLTIINVKAGTKYAELTDSGAVALPSRAVWSVIFGKNTNTIYVGTEGGVGAYSVNPLSEIKRYTSWSTPATLSTYNQDVFYNSNKDYLVVSTSIGASVIDVGKAKNILDVTKLSENPTFPINSLTDVVVDQTLGLAMVSQYYGVVSILNLSSSKIEVNLTNADLVNGNACGAITKVIYSQERHWLMTACSSGSGPNVHNAVGIYNISSRKFVRYYDDTTTPALLLSPWPGYYGYVYTMAYDSFRNVLVFGQYYAGILVLNLTTNATYSITGSTPDPMRVQITYGVYDVALDLARSIIVLADYSYGISIFNYSSNNRYDITGSTNPTIYVYVNRVALDLRTHYLYAGGYNGLDVYNISNPASIKLVTRYNTGTNPYLPATWYNHMHIDSSLNMIFIGSNSGAYGLDLTTNTTPKRYTTSTSPALFQATANGFTNYRAEDWDLIATTNTLQIIKHDPTPMDPEVWMGRSLIWRKSGAFNTTAMISGLGQKVESALAKADKKEPDAFGFIMAELNLKIITQRAGTLTLDDIAIEYSHTSRSPDLSPAINAYIGSVGTGWDGTVPLAATSGSAGKLTIKDLKVEIDEAPKFTAFPDNLWIFENSFQGRLVDINNHVSDDYDLKTDLKYTAKALTNTTKVEVGIFEGHFIYIDSLSKPESVNWTGTVEVIVTATDTRGLTRTSKPFTVRVEPVSAVVITSTPGTVVMEDQSYTYDVEAVSHRALPLTYKLDKAPAGMQMVDTTGLISWTPGNSDVGSHNITINVSDGNDSAYQSYLLSVVNINDGPVLGAIPELTCYEGVNKLLDLSKYVTDVDDLPANLSVMVKSSYATVTGLQVLLKYPLNSGMTSENITVSVSDGKAIATAVVKVKVLGVFKIAPIPDQTATEGTTLVLNLAQFIRDPQAKKLTITATSPYVKVNKTNLEIAYPVGSKVTLDNISVKFSDGTSINDTTIGIKVRVNAVFPSANIASPASGSKVTRTITVTGTATIPSGNITKVMIRIDNGDWVEATGTTSWSYTLKPKDLKLKDGIHYIRVQAWCNNVPSPEKEVDIVVKNPSPAKVGAETSLMLGLIIGLILAIILAVVGYAIGKKKRGGPDAPVQERTMRAQPRGMPSQPEEPETDRPFRDSRPSRGPRQTRPPVRSRPSPPPMEEAAVTEPAPEQVEPGPPAQMEVEAVNPPVEPEAYVEQTTIVEQSFEPVTADPEVSADIPAPEPEVTPEEPTPEPKVEEQPPEEKPKPGPPKGTKTEKSRSSTSGMTSNIDLSEILKKLEK